MIKVSVLCGFMMALFAFASCNSGEGTFTEKELSLINGADSIMRVLTIDRPADLAILRAQSEDLSSEALSSEAFVTLCSQMIATVTHPSQDGVGIAGPQVGLNRRVVAVQRFDKEGEPFEVYGNIRIVAHHGEKAPGGEGCLSVPDKRGDVMRWQDIEIEYDAVFSEGKVTVQPARERIQGFTAVIFQHETDHLDGILYIDRL
ncbi:MAG: peptide deformylase [Bacteroidales bacterium]|nr:peptide deformylase [Bacteroidales bacterium]